MAFTTLAITFAGDLPSANAAEQKLLESGDLTAYVRQGRLCRRRINVTVRGQDAAAFAQNKREKIGEVLRKDLVSKCPKARTILINGYIGSARVYVGTIRNITQQAKLEDRYLRKDLRAPAQSPQQSAGRGRGDRQGTEK